MELAIYKNIETSCDGHIYPSYRDYSSLKKMSAIDSSINEQYIKQANSYILGYKHQFRYGSSINLDIDIFKYGDRDPQVLQLDKIGKIGIDRFKLYANLERINRDIIPNKSSLGVVTDNNGLKVIDISTGEYLHINKYDYTSIENIDTLNKQNHRYKISINQIANPSKGINMYGTIIDTTAPRLLNGMHNIYNIHNEDEINSVLDILQYELEDKGLYVKIEDASVKEIEINRTFIWNNSIIDEEDILDYTFKVLRKDKSNNNKSNSNKRVVKKEKESFTYSIDTSRMKIKVYTKSEQIINTIGYDCGKHLCRVELTLKRSGIRNAYGKESISILKDSTKTQDIFISNMNKKVVAPLKVHFMKEILEIENIIKGYERCNYTTLDLVYKLISKELFDVVLLGIAAVNVYEEKGNNNFKRDFKRLLNDVSKSHINRYATLEKLVSNIIDEDIKLIHIPEKVKYSLKSI